MIRKTDEFRSEVRENMRGGAGTVRIEHLWEPGREMKSANRMAARLIIEPGCGIGTHRHDGEDEIFYILHGTAEVDDDGTCRVLSAGDTILTGNAAHSIKNIGDAALVVLAVISTHKQN